MRKIFLLLCVAFAVVCYAYPCFVLPFGTYNYDYMNQYTQKMETATLQFGFNGKVVDQDGVEMFYKLNGTEIIISEDEKFDAATDMVVKYKNIYQLHVPADGVDEKPAAVLTYRNVIGLYVTIGIGVVAVLLVITIPRKKN